MISSHTKCFVMHVNFYIKCFFYIDICQSNERKNVLYIDANVKIDLKIWEYEQPTFETHRIQWGLFFNIRNWNRAIDLESKTKLLFNIYKMRIRFHKTRWPISWLLNNFSHISTMLFAQYIHLEKWKIRPKKKKICFDRKVFCFSVKTITQSFVVTYSREKSTNSLSSETFNLHLANQMTHSPKNGIHRFLCPKVNDKQGP